MKSVYQVHPLGTLDPILSRRPFFKLKYPYWYCPDCPMFFDHRETKENLPVHHQHLDVQYYMEAANFVGH